MSSTTTPMRYATVRSSPCSPSSPVARDPATSLNRPENWVHFRHKYQNAVLASQHNALVYRTIMGSMSGMERAREIAAELGLTQIDLDIIRDAGRVTLPGAQGVGRAIDAQDSPEDVNCRTVQAMPPDHVPAHVPDQSLRQEVAITAVPSTTAVAEKASITLAVWHGAEQIADSTVIAQAERPLHGNNHATDVHDEASCWEEPGVIDKRDDHRYMPAPYHSREDRLSTLRESYDPLTGPYSRHDYSTDGHIYGEPLYSSARYRLSSPIRTRGRRASTKAAYPPRHGGGGRNDHPGLLERGNLPHRLQRKWDGADDYQRQQGMCSPLTGRHGPGDSYGRARQYIPYSRDAAPPLWYDHQYTVQPSHSSLLSSWSCWPSNGVSLSPEIYPYYYMGGPEYYYARDYESRTSLSYHERLVDDYRNESLTHLRMSSSRIKARQDHRHHTRYDPVHDAANCDARRRDRVAEARRAPKMIY